MFKVNASFQGMKVLFFFILSKLAVRENLLRFVRLLS